MPTNNDDVSKQQLDQLKYQTELMKSCAGMGCGCMMLIAGICGLALVIGLVF